MSDITFEQIFNQITNNYNEYRMINKSSLDVPSLVKKALPKKLKEVVSSDKYKIIGSVGKGNISEIPWVAIIKNNSIFTPQKGIYLVFLFSSDMKNIYFSLNQGFYTLRDNYKTKRGKTIARLTAKYLREALSLNPYADLSGIKLNSNGTLGKGYEAGDIISIKYDSYNIPHDTRIENDIKKMIAIYEDAIEIIGKRDIAEFYDFINALNRGLVFDDRDNIGNIYKIIEEDENSSKNVPEYSLEPKKKKDTIKDYNMNSKYPRDNKVAANALRIAEFLCENEIEHKFFNSKKANKNYTESHHLIPLSQYSRFEFSLDVEENICSLCSVCHDCVHYGTIEERDKILFKLYKSRIEMLREVGLYVEFEELKSFY